MATRTQKLLLVLGVSMLTSAPVFGADDAHAGHGLVEVGLGAGPPRGERGGEHDGGGDDPPAAEQGGHVGPQVDGHHCGGLRVR